MEALGAKVYSTPDVDRSISTLVRFCLALSSTATPTFLGKVWSTLRVTCRLELRILPVRLDNWFVVTGVRPVDCKMPQGSMQLLPSSSEPGLKPKGHEHQTPPPELLLSAHTDFASQPIVGAPTLQGSHCVVELKPGVNFELRTIEPVIRVGLKLQLLKFETMITSLAFPTNEIPRADELRINALPPRSIRPCDAGPCCKAIADSLIERALVA
jgi:hypothetical protein